MASSADHGAAAKAADTVKGKMDGATGGYASKEIGEENSKKTEDSSGFISTSSAKDAVANATSESKDQ